MITQIVRIVSVFCFIFLCTGGFVYGEDCEKVKKDYDALLAEYNNLMVQSKVLLQMKEKAQDLEEAMQRFNQEKDSIVKKAAQEKEDLISQFKKEKETLIRQYEKEGSDTTQQIVLEKNIAVKEKEEALARVRQDIEDATRHLTLQKDALMKERDDALKQAAEFSARARRLDESSAKLMKERDEYKRSFEKASVENIIGEEARKKIIDLEKENTSLGKQYEDAQERMKLVDNELLKRQAEVELMRRQLAEAKEKYEEGRKQNRALESKLEALPRNFTELARENKILIKRTSLMHYNLGVFYTQNKEFERALAEFENAVELNPEDGLSYFNLGYIYAERLQNRPKAVENFKKFLKLAKKDDKDADWAKRYILTWQAWEGGTPIK